MHKLLGDLVDYISEDAFVKQANKIFSPENTKLKLCEEMSELIKPIIKMQLGSKTKENLYNFHEELADVIIVITRVYNQLPVEEKIVVEKFVDMKVERFKEITCAKENH